MSPWINFALVVFVQFLFFLFLTYHKRASVKITADIVVKNILGGVFVGALGDLLGGKYLGILSYVLGFHLPFLIINGALAYGLWLLTLRLLHKESLMSFLAWNTLMGLVYEVVNYFYPVWLWPFQGSFLYQTGMIMLVGYWVPALLVALIASLTTQVKFNALKLKIGRA